MFGVEMLIALQDYELEPKLEAEPKGPPTLQALEGFQEFSERHLPALVETSLETIVQSRLHPFEHELKKTLGDLVRSLLSQLFQTYKESAREKPGSSEQGGMQNDPTASESSSRPKCLDEGCSMVDLASFFIVPLPATLSSDALDESGAGLQPSSSQGLSDSGYESLQPYPCICNSSHDPFGLQASSLATRMDSDHQTYATANASFPRARRANSDTSKEAHIVSGGDSNSQTGSDMEGKEPERVSIDSLPNLCDHCFGLL
jgi:hypothetical protein